MGQETHLTSSLNLQMRQIKLRTRKQVRSRVKVRAQTIFSFGKHTLTPSKRFSRHQGYLSDEQGHTFWPLLSYPMLPTNLLPVRISDIPFKTAYCWLKTQTSLGVNLKGHRVREGSSSPGICVLTFFGHFCQVSWKTYTGLSFVWMSLEGRFSSYVFFSSILGKGLNALSLDKTLNP